MIHDATEGKSKKQAIIWVIVVIVSAAAILLGNRIATKDITLFKNADGETEKAKVTKIIKKTSEKKQLDGAETAVYTQIQFECKVKTGDDKGKVITAGQSFDDLYIINGYMKEVEAGDNILLYRAEESNAWEFIDYNRFDNIIILGIIFALLVLFIGRKKGVNTLLSLVFTFLFVFLVFVPAIMNSYNIYICTAITCFYTIIMTLLLVSGANRKTLATMIGCTSGTIIAAIITAIMNKVLALTGVTDEHSIYLAMLNPDNPIDLPAIVFAAIVIGAMGAIMDIAMDISSSLFELSSHVKEITFKQLFKSGMRIGGDVMGTMANTLVLAYIGSSLSSILLLLVNSMSMTYLLNREIIIIEFLQALAGSMAILLTIPLTVLTCGFLYLKKKPAADHNLFIPADEQPIRRR